MFSNRSATPSFAAGQRGFSLIELMVGMAVALAFSLVLFNTLLFAEGQRRSIGGGNDAQQAGSFASYTLERYVRMGGAGIERVDGFWGGCQLSASYNGQVVLPLPTGTNLPPPFDGLSGLGLRAAPVLIANASVKANDTAADSTPDALLVMAGTSPNLNTWLQGRGNATVTAAHVVNSIGVNTGDVLIAVEQDPSKPNYGSGHLCRFAQIKSTIDNVPTSPSYLQTTDDSGRSVVIGGNSYATSDGFAPGGVPYSGTTLYADLGKAPLFQIMALGSSLANPTELRSYNMLTGAVESIGDNVVNLQAVYGLRDPAASGCQVTSWSPPVGTFSITSLMGGSAGAQANLNRICAIRLGMIVRSPLQEKNDVEAPATWTLFDDDPALRVSATRTGTDLKYRYRQYDVIVPVRNQLQ